MDTIIGLLVIVVIIFVCRDIICWWWKINRIVDLLESINKAVGGDSPSVEKKMGALFDKLGNKIDKLSGSKDSRPPSVPEKK